ncbi:alpha/beta fold hydrolase [Pelatocladus sp. BLCC-F211]|uniref:alpha/beta fold hydrolase n=1 Tax=Pelatocladus sp. BLCC-F211 TaxID=3342752 RepID=UPI0035B9ED0D
MQTPTDQYTSVDGIKTRYWQVGEQGTPLVLIHGAGGAIDYWYKNVFALAERHRVYALDLVGSGKSDKPDETYTYDDLSRFVVSFMNALEIPQASFIAASAGGAIALKLTLAFPERVNKLILVGSAGLGEKVAFTARLTSIPGIGEALNRPSLATARFFIRQCAYNSAPFLNNEFINLVYRNLSLEVLQFQLRTFRTTANFWGVKSEFLRSIVEHLSEIQVPTLVVWGKQDKLIPVEYASIATQKISFAKLHLFDQCGHWCYLEYPNEFNGLVIDFLSEPLETLLLQQSKGLARK